MQLKPLGMMSHPAVGFRGLSLSINPFRSNARDIQIHGTKIRQNSPLTIFFFFFQEAFQLPSNWGVHLQMCLNYDLEMGSAYTSLHLQNRSKKKSGSTQSITISSFNRELRHM